MIFRDSKKKAQKAYEARWKKVEDAAPGWLAIDENLKSIYGEREPDKHWASPIESRAILGGSEIIDGVSVYANDEQTVHHHLITYGLSDLYYSPESVGGEFSGYGFELTFRVKHQNDYGNDGPVFATNVMRNIANYVHSSKKVISENHFMPAGGSLRLGYESEIQACLFVYDPQLPVITDPHGRVEFIQLVGITMPEYEAMRDGKILAHELANQLSGNNRLLVTDLDRSSLI